MAEPVTLRPIERMAALIAWRAGHDAAVAAALEARGAVLPDPGCFTEHDGLLLARTAPHQLLALREGEGDTLMDELSPLADSAGVIDLSDSRVACRLEGPGARDSLSRLVPLDLAPGQFGPGRCAQTLAAHLSVLLLQVGPESFELQAGRSFAGSFLRAVEVASGQAAG